MNKDLIHRNRKDNWGTPKEIFEPLDSIYKFDVDLAATRENALAPAYIGPDHEDVDSRNFLELSQGLLRKVCWINPPYGRNLGPFTDKISKLAAWGTHIVALLPASMDTRWMHDNVLSTARIYFRAGRIAFVDPDTGKPAKGNPGASLLALYNLPHDVRLDLAGWVGR